MLQNVTVTPARRSLEFGIYRDGDNNLDAIQESTLSQALRTSAHDSRIEFTVEDTTALRAPVVPRQGPDGKGGLRTYDYTISDGDVGNVRSDKAADMSDEANLARFVTRTLDNAQANGAKQTWIDLVDHGGGDGGGLQTGDGSVMSMPDIAKASLRRSGDARGRPPRRCPALDRRCRRKPMPNGHNGLRGRALQCRRAVPRR